LALPFFLVSDHFFINDLEELFGQPFPLMPHYNKGRIEALSMYNSRA
jgi:hypothetical protein